MKEFEETIKEMNYIPSTEAGELLLMAVLLIYDRKGMGVEESTGTIIRKLQRMRRDRLYTSGGE